MTTKFLALTIIEISPHFHAHYLYKHTMRYTGVEVIKIILSRNSNAQKITIRVRITYYFYNKLALIL